MWAMKQFYLTEIVTKDSLIHQGIFYKPTKSRYSAILWVHGLTDNFYGDLSTLEALGECCEKEGWGLASFNTRGHDIIASVKKLDPQNPKGQTSVSLGSSYEKFSECVYDIDAAITFLKHQGFAQVILAGISTGANKVCYYAGTQRDPRVAAVVLASPLGDVPIESKEPKFTHNLKRAKQFVLKGQGDRLLEGITYLPLTAKRYLSLYQSGTVEDVFDYYVKQPKLTVFSKITKPLCIVFGGADEYSDRPVKDILAVLRKYQKSKNYHEAIIPGAFHSLGGKEKEFVKTLTPWLNSLK